MGSIHRPGQNLPPSKVDLFTKGIVHRDVYPGIDPLAKSNCTGKAILITGASRGFGRAIAVGYALAGAARIAIAARSDLTETAASILSAASSANRPKPEILQLSMDVTNAASVRSAAAELEAAWGRLDIVVSNAGYMASFALTLDGDDDEYRKAWDINFWGTYNVSKAFLPLMLLGGDKTIVTISSIAAHFAGVGGGPYHISKLALARLTEQIHEEYKDQGVLAYSVHPGGTPTELSDKLPDIFKFRMTDTPELAGHSLPFLTTQRLEWLGGRWISCKWDLPELLIMAEHIVEEDLLKFRCTGF